MNLIFPALLKWHGRIEHHLTAIQLSYGLSESEVIDLMRQEMKASSFKMWRKRVTGRASKHMQLRNSSITRAYCPTQYKQK
jgi:uncharacterized protein (TIGR03643 family)